MRCTASLTAARASRAVAIGAYPGAFRKVFVRILGLTPGEYRRRFGVGSQPQT